MKDSQSQNGRERLGKMYEINEWEALPSSPLEMVNLKSRRLTMQ